MPHPVAFLNGTLVAESEARLHVFDLGVVAGTSVTEMIRTFRHEPFRLDAHLERLERSLRATELDPGWSRDALEGICRDVTRQNAALIPNTSDLGLIVFVTAGLNPTYVGKMAARAQGPTVCVHTFPLPFENWRAGYTSGIGLVSVATHPIPETVIDPRIKHRSRLHWHLAAREAARQDPTAQALLTADDGSLTETATGNLCIVDGATIVTPSHGVLDGVSREYVGELARRAGFTFVHAPVPAEDLAHADEAFLTSTPSCLLPVTRFNGRPIGNGTPGPLFQRLLSDWSQNVGVDIASQT